MKTRNIIVSLIACLFTFSALQAQNNLWSDNTANTLQKGRKEIGLFGAYKIGIRDSIEISTHPIWFLLMPNVSVKKKWSPMMGLSFASKHSFTYPTLFLNAISRSGTGGILPSTSVIPQRFKFNNSIILTKTLNTKTAVSFNAGIDLSLGFGKSDFTDIEFHYAYPRVYSFNHVYVPYAGLDGMTSLTNKLMLNYTMQTFFFMEENDGMMIEQRLKLAYAFSNKFRIMAGVTSSFGQYPYGKDSNIFPILDLYWGLGK